jgi:trehalose/maltose transport system permease protein
MLNDQLGIINDLLMRNMGLITQKHRLDRKYGDTAMTAVLVVDVWKTTPFMALLILAGLQMIPKDVYEAAELDGVHPVKQFFRDHPAAGPPGADGRHHLPPARRACASST